jgi:hypothetical protein
VISIQAQPDLTLKPGAQAHRQHQWLVIRHTHHDIGIYDSLGNKMDSINTGKRSIDFVSTDKFGNFIINCTGDVEFSRIAIYYSKKGSELWRYNYGFMGDGGMELSPDGKYAVLSVCPVGQFTLFSTADTSNKLPNPLIGLDRNMNLVSHFANDGSLVIITRTATLYRYNCSTAKLEGPKEIKSPNGVAFSLLDGFAFNSDQTLFSVRLFEVTDTQFTKINWLLVYNKSLDIKLLTRINEQIIDFKIADSLILTSRLNNSTSKYIGSMINANTQQETIIDSDLGGYIDIPFISDNSLYFNVPANGKYFNIRKYDFNKQALEKGVPSIPIVKAKMNKQSQVPSLKFTNQ